MLKLDPWQKKVLETKGNICLRSGRQVGKSTIVSIKAGDYALDNEKKSVMIIAKVERQAQLLFEKILAHIYEKNKNQIKKGKDRPTKHKLILKNGSVIHCLPAGESGYGIRGFTIDLLIADEAAFIPEDVWTAVTPMLTITKGTIWLLSTPHGKEGFFFRCFSDEKYNSFHVSSEDCPRKDQDFLDHEKNWMTKAQYAQEYLGLFLDELQQIYSDALITETCALEKRKGKLRDRDLFLGVDIAGMGVDKSTFEILDGTIKEAIEQIENLVTEKTRTTDTTKKILELEKQWNFNKIGVDDGGMGVGVFDQLLEDETTRRKIVGLNNAKRNYERDSSGKEIKWKKKRLLKEDMYAHLLMLMERQEIKLLDDLEIKASLKSIQYDEDTGKIIGNDSHITEGIIRATYLIKNKNLNTYVM